MSPSNHAATAALHLACTRADERGVAKALGSGADVNALDDEQRSVLWLALLGDCDIENAPDSNTEDAARVAVLTLLLRQPSISLMTLNSARIVTPLALAAWLNRPKSVHAILRDSDGAAAVDCMDAGWATPLMYAARDGSVDVARILLSHGARADLCDANGRSVLQHALGSPQIMWMCELALRRQRLKSIVRKQRQLMNASDQASAALNGQLATLVTNSIPPEGIFAPPSANRLSSRALAASVTSLVAAVHVGNPDLLHSLLFPPQSSVAPVALVNLADANGLAPLHHAVRVDAPRRDIVDALHHAGADMCLPTLDGSRSTPLHLFARNAIDGMSGLYQLTVHLVKGVRCSLSAKDANGETALHVAAEMGLSGEVLLAFIDCDAGGAVRDMPNGRGLTPREVAQPQFAALFAPEGRPVSTDSAQTIRGAASRRQSRQQLSQVDHHHSNGGVPHVASSASLRTTGQSVYSVRTTATYKTAASSVMSLPNRSKIGEPSPIILSSKDTLRAIRILCENLNSHSRYPTPGGAVDADALRSQMSETAQLARAVMDSWRARLEIATDEAVDLRGIRARAAAVLASAREVHRERTVELEAAEKKRVNGERLKKRASFLPGRLANLGSSSKSLSNVKSSPDLRSPSSSSSLVGVLKGVFRSARKKPSLKISTGDLKSAPADAMMSPVQSVMAFSPPSSPALRSPPASVRGKPAWHDMSPPASMRGKPTWADLPPSPGGPGASTVLVAGEDGNPVDPAVVRNAPKLFARIDVDLREMDEALAELERSFARARYAITSSEASIEHFVARREEEALDMWFTRALEQPEREFGVVPPPTPPKSGASASSYASLTQHRGAGTGTISAAASSSVISHHGRTSSVSSGAVSVCTAATSLPGSPASASASRTHHHKYNIGASPLHPQAQAVVPSAPAPESGLDALPELLGGTGIALDAVEAEVARLAKWTRVTRDTAKSARRALVG